MDPQTNHKLVTFRQEILDTVQRELGVQQLDLPLYLPTSSPLNDGLNGEEPVLFRGKDSTEYQIVHSHALIKRFKINKHTDYYQEFVLPAELPYTIQQVDDGIEVSFVPQAVPAAEPKVIGLVSYLQAIRKLEELDATHSMYVRQSDWCARVPKRVVQQDKLEILYYFIFRVIKSISALLADEPIPQDQPFTFFIGSSQTFLKLHAEKIAELTAANDLAGYEALRSAWEYQLGQRYTYFAVTEIGAKLNDRWAYDARAHNYDDWEANADIFVWCPALNRSLEVSSMGYRVNAESLRKQLDAVQISDDKISSYERELLEGRVVSTIGGGIGLDRLAMLKLKAPGIGQVVDFL